MAETIFITATLALLVCYYGCIIQPRQHEKKRKQDAQRRAAKTKQEIDSLFEIDENDLEEIRNVFHNQRN